jgi:large subunit ribosomal protein L13
MVTGLKKDLKLYRHHTDYPGGLKTHTMRQVMDIEPSRVIIQAVKGMLPRNRTRRHILADI